MRIIAGSLKGREVLPSPGMNTRPVTAMVKKSLFDTLAPYLQDAVAADLYCGTGTMGFEAISRGARRCYFAERDARALSLLRNNIQTLGLDGLCTLWAGDLTERLKGWLAELPGPLDVAFVDPPYADARTWSWPEATEQIFTPLAGALADEGLVVLRLPGKVGCPQRLGALEIVRTKCYGDMSVVLLTRAGETS